MNNSRSSLSALLPFVVILALVSPCTPAWTAAQKPSTIFHAEDYEEIQNLIAKYYDSIWRRDLDAFVSTFTDDGELIVRGSVTDEAPMAVTNNYKGHAAIREFMATVFPQKPHPLANNHVINPLSPNRAYGSVTVQFFSNSDFTLKYMAYYQDEYVKVSGHWLFQRREIQILKPGMDIDSRR